MRKVYKFTMAVSAILLLGILGGIDHNNLSLRTGSTLAVICSITLIGSMKLLETSERRGDND